MISNLRFKIRIYADLVKYIENDDKRKEVLSLIEEMLELFLMR